MGDCRATFNTEARWRGIVVCGVLKNCLANEPLHQWAVVEIASPTCSARIGLWQPPTNKRVFVIPLCYIIKALTRDQATTFYAYPPAVGRLLDKVVLLRWWKLKSCV
jgi:hypothetical protein